MLSCGASLALGRMLITLSFRPEPPLGHDLAAVMLGSFSFLFLFSIFFSCIFAVVVTVRDAADSLYLANYQPLVGCCVGGSLLLLGYIALWHHSAYIWTIFNAIKQVRTYILPWTRHTTTCFDRIKFCHQIPPQPFHNLHTTAVGNDIFRAGAQSGLCSLPSSYLASRWYLCFWVTSLR